MKEVIAELRDYMNECLSVVETAPNTRNGELHPSSFPYCGVRHFHDLQMGYLEMGEVDFNMDFYCSTGTTFHSLVQKWLGAGDQIIGDWRCLSCGHEEKFSTKDICPKCGARMLYEELLIKWKNVLGHCDGLWKRTLKDGTVEYWIIDYKTCSSMSIYQHKRSGKVFPYAYNVPQIESYVVLIQKLYNVKVKGWILIYVARDQPKQNFVPVGRKVTPSQKKMIWERIKRDNRHFGIVKQAESLLDIKTVVEEKPCQSMAEYKKSPYNGKYEQCPLASVCFNPKKLRLTLKEAIEHQGDESEETED